MNEKERGRSAGTETTSSITTQTQLNSIDKFCQSIPDLRDVVDMTQLRPRDAVKVIRTQFPSFDQTALSKCMKPEKYGMVLHPRGYMELAKYVKFSMDTQAEEKSVAAKPTEAVVSRRPDNRKYPNRISGRIPADLFERLQKRMAEDGYATMQDWIYAMATDYVFRGEAVARE